MLSVQNIEYIWEVSPMQENIFIHSVLHPGSSAYFRQTAYRIKGELQLEYMQKSLDQLFSRYDILRSVYIQKNEKRPMQVVLKERSAVLCFEDLSGEPDAERRMAELKENDRRKGFDLRKDVLMRVTIVRLKDGYEFIWSCHHIIMDGWCIDILVTDLLEIYNGYRTGRPARLKVVRPFRDYLEWLQGQDKEASLGYWRNYLQDYNRTALIPGKNTAHKEGSVYVQGRVEFPVDAATTAGLRQVAARNRITLNTLISTIWGVLIARYNDVRDVVFGAVVSGRPPSLPGIESMVGLFINTIPVRVRYDKTTPFRALLRQTGADSLESLPHHYAQLAEVQAESLLGQRLFEHILIFENYPLTGRPKDSAGGAGEEDIEVISVDIIEQTSYDFNVVIFPGKELLIRVDYNVRVYEEEYIRRMEGHIRELVRQVLQDDGVCLGDMEIVGGREREQLVRAGTSGFGNATEKENGTQRSLIRLFEEQVKRDASAPAVLYQQQRMTYGELNEQANRLAHHLLAQYPKKGGKLVGVLLERSPRLIVALLAILKSGAGFLLIDLFYPDERIAYILADAAPGILITDSSLSKRIGEGPRVLEIDVLLPQPEGRSDDPDQGYDAAALAYVIYTSGSTGEPKGVEIRQGSFVNYMVWANSYYFNNERGYPFALFTALSFDLTLTSIFTTLIRGDAIVVCPEEPVGILLAGLFGKDSPVNTVKLTPSHISLLGGLPIRRSPVRKVIAGGEQLTDEQTAILFRLNPEIIIYNEYGPTEATIGCTVKDIFAGNGKINVGKPIAGSRVYILDQDLHLMPVGATGEIYIGGPGLAAGYRNKPGLTQEKFVNDPFGAGDFQRLYRSGDLGRWLPDGDLEYLGRKDSQVKIRGYRIELGEIERRLLQHPAISEAVTIARSDEGGDARLIAYVRTSETMTPGQLRNFLGRYLPGYMIPADFVFVDRMPLNGNGKLDLSRLPAPEDRGTDGDYAIAGDEIERELAAAWRKVLNRERFGIHDNFFEVGGHSLLVLRLLNLVDTRYPGMLDIFEIYEKATIAQQADTIRKKTAKDPCIPQFRVL
jgi:amino acid adenylation domain-containing protein